MKPDRYGVIGQPVAHSLSPRIHTLFAQQTKQTLSYEALEVAPEALTDTLKKLHAENWRGFNLTLPHKLAVAALCESVSEPAQLAGAVNTLIRTDTGWKGDNTDGVGLIRDLKTQGIIVTGKRVLLLGAGGAARGVLKPLLDEKPAELALSNRNPWKPERIAAEFKSFGNIRPATHLSLRGDRFDLIINATSAGHDGVMPRLSADVLASNGACYDLSYGKPHLPFAVWARRQSAAKIADGLGMLVEQAAASFELWRGVRPTTVAVLGELRKAA